MQRSLERFGWRGVVIARKSDRVVLAGNARVQCAKKLGWDEAPVVFVDDDHSTSLAYAIADNRTAELATWNLDNLSEAMAELDADDLPGFTIAEVESMLATPVLGDADDATVQRLNEQGQDEMVRRETSVVVRVRVPKARAADAKQALTVTAESFGGELL